MCNDNDKILASIDNIKMYIIRLSLSTNQAVDIILKELKNELTSYKIEEASGFNNEEKINQYPNKKFSEALEIMKSIKIANDKKNIDQFKILIKELELKLIEIYNSVELEAC